MYHKRIELEANKLCTNHDGRSGMEPEGLGLTILEDYLEDVSVAIARWQVIRRNLQELKIYKE